MRKNGHTESQSREVHPRILYCLFFVMVYLQLCTTDQVKEGPLEVYDVTILCFRDFCMLWSALLFQYPTCLLLKVTSFPFTEGEKEVCTVQELKENNIYSRGNHRDFTSFLQKQTNQDNPKVLSMIALLLFAGLTEVASCWLLHNLTRQATMLCCFPASLEQDHIISHQL